MSSFSRRSLLLALAGLPACGFTPLYAPGSGAAALRGRVAIGAPDSSNAFSLVRALELRLGAAEAAQFALTVDVMLEERGSVITSTQEIDRFTLRGAAGYTLSDLDGTLITRGQARGFTNYSASGTPLATRASRADALERLMVILADTIVTRLASAVA